MQSSKGEYFREMTVAHIRDKASPEFIEVIFIESAMFYRLYRKNPDFNNAFLLLKISMTEGKKLIVKLNSIDGEIIKEIR